MVERDNADFSLTLSEVLAMPVSTIATKRVISVNIDNDMGAVAKVLADNHLKKAPVLQGDRMVGIINRSNITGYAVHHLLEHPAH